jgi:hypothetical protein
MTGGLFPSHIGTMVALMQIGIMYPSFLEGNSSRRLIMLLEFLAFLVLLIQLVIPNGHVVLLLTCLSSK